MNLRITRQEWAWGLKVSVPVAMCLAIGAVALFGEEEDPVIGRGKVMAAGLSGKWGEKGQAKRMRTREARDVATSQMRLRRPLGIEAAVGGVIRGEMEEAISGLYRGVDFGKQRSGWEFLGRGVRAEIDLGQPEAGRWAGIMIHGSGTASGGADTLGHYHRRVRGLRGGMAYHFVVGNGSHSGLGEIEVGERWLRQEGGELLGVEDGGLIEICMIGDFGREAAAVEQLEALDELIDYLRAKVGDVPIDFHEAKTPGSFGCLGAKFPRSVVLGNGG